MVDYRAVLVPKDVAVWARAKYHVPTELHRSSTGRSPVGAVTYLQASSARAAASVRRVSDTTCWYLLTFTNYDDGTSKLTRVDGDRVTLAIARAGAALSTNLDLAHVCVAHMATVNRASSSTEISAPSVECVNLYTWFAQGSQASNPVLHPGDVVVVMSSQKAPVQPPT